MKSKLNTIILVLILGVVSFTAYKLLTKSNEKAAAGDTAASAAQASTDAFRTAADQAKNAQNPFAQQTDPAEASEPIGPTTLLSFEKNEHDFGTIPAEGKVTTSFKFTNTGDEPLIIANAAGSCGCTVPDYPKEPIPPGETAEMDVEFDPKGKKGSQTKYVTVRANTDPPVTRIAIKAFIEGEGSTASTDQ